MIDIQEQFEKAQGKIRKKLEKNFEEKIKNLTKYELIFLAMTYTENYKYNTEEFMKDRLLKMQKEIVNRRKKGEW